MTRGSDPATTIAVLVGVMIIATGVVLAVIWFGVR